MSETSPIPIILCGKTEFIGERVIGALKPEIEVVQFILPGDSGQVIIPALLAGKSPPSHPDSSAIGSGNYNNAPRAVVLGGAFEESDIATLRDAVKTVNGARGVAWLRQDTTQPAPPVTSPEYPKLMTRRTKEAVIKLNKDGKLDGTYDGLEWY
ncbi:hypothetical protein IWW34DRAFT_910075 [Fusarium oxysporum f. sp. albedinis]|uniref:Uncharacterized protein n=6 Tax=Fusarium oxysporum TaxID=5507 RepID=A0A2H3FWV4_FUSOX|nr:uncharacterized protein FOBCDRAFT_324912 [Fusarium oxysporum Fo47]EWZ83472.1 hypothetical protein FOWG_13363 [Fusarium oxysporum f. sp. lycopersici MN25]KAH7467481.1 hypothetical protein FOMA001_g15374 [Fusarium oxysporum f. sp. matthiolae]KAI3580245.1 hypothetical protein IWW34DRAFT_910075 [Fusarium oxysporum f. sp. albedinis]KAJ4161884.1 hypothetical protein NW765_009971 [Fusarium oxysporum]PCD23571.1 hypothetical protein AU210_015088 [Fusarium oxysporum f. sp. radicis-cucumerinum]RKK093